MINAKYVDGLELRIRELSKKLSDEADAALQLIAENKSLKAGRDALAAQVEAVKSLFPLNCLVGCDGILHYPVAQYNKVVDALNTTPQQHLAEIRAQAGRAGYLQGHLDAAGDDVGEWSRKHSEYHAKQYADSIRRGEVK